WITSFLRVTPSPPADLGRRPVRHSQLVHWRVRSSQTSTVEIQFSCRRLELGCCVLSSVLREPPTALQASGLRCTGALSSPLENCRASTSIFGDRLPGGLRTRTCSSKLRRANGGCLGVSNR